ncbi:hypothetical protein ACFT9I_01675 [Streptomyces sp. NPDC057137]|uniref:hypothetical protein n=1 Tax=Streptomyces sp. NPDC057137 TaxID=3346030 RepID=UPI003628AF92
MLAGAADAPIGLTGSESITTEIGNIVSPDATLYRTSIGAMTEVMRLLTEGHRVTLTRVGQTLQALAFAARDLKKGRRTTHSGLVLFASSGKLQDYAAFDPAGRDLQPFVDTHGSDAILNAVDKITEEKHADVTVSTAQIAKSRE